MPKHIDSLGTFDAFRAPWETADGSEAEIDKPKLKRWIFGLMTDKAKAQDARDEATEKVSALEGELETAKAEAASANGEEAQKKIDKLERDLDKAKGDLKALQDEKEHNELRAEVLGDLDKKYAKYVTGTTREELEKSLADVKADFGLEDGEPGDDDEENDLEKVARSKPTSRLRNLRDPKPGEGGEELDYEKIAAELVPGSRL